MTDHQARHLEMVELTLRAADGDLDADGYARLESLLSGDAQAREDYAELVLTLSALDWDAGSKTHVARAADHAVRQVILSDVVDEALAERRKHEIEADAQAQLLADLKAQKRDSDLDRRRAAQQRKDSDRPTKVIIIPKMVAAIGIAAAIALMVVGVTAFLPNKPAPQHTQTPDPPTRQAPAAPVLVAHVDASLDAQWGNGQRVTPGQSLYGGQARTLEGGIVSLTLTNGVTLTLEAPVAFTPVSDGLVELSHGKLVGYVPDGAEGFTVHAPGMVVVDLGTEFAVDADTQTGSRVHVLDGSVRLQPPSDMANDAGFAVEEVQAGHARKVDAQGDALSEVVSEPTAFYRAVPTPYERMIRDAGPLVYWRFNGRNEADELVGLGALGSDIPGVAESRIDPRNTPPVSEEGDAALFLSRQDRGLHPEGVNEGLDLTDNFTIEAWVFVPSGSDRRMRILSNNGRASDGGLTGGFGFGVSGGPADEAGGPVLLFTGYNVFDAFSHEAVPTGRWVHVAVILSGQDQLAMYIDGEHITHHVVHHAQWVGRAVVTPSATSARIGDALMTVPGPSEEYWVGGMDELAVYGRVLSREEIADHAAFDPDSELENSLPARDGR